MYAFIKCPCGLDTLLLSFMLLTACNDMLVIEGEPEKLVVEGWIENNKHPVVIITRSIPVTSNHQDVNDLNAYAVQSAEFRISDGESEVVLQGMENQSYVHSYIYTTKEMTGEIGKTYQLTIDYQEHHLESSTRIMTLPCIDSLSVAEVEDSLFQVKVFLKDTDAVPNYFKTFTMIHPQQTFYLSFLGSTFTDRDLILNDGMGIYPGDYFVNKYESSYFSYRDTLILKVTQINEEGYIYWKEFEQMLGTARNPLFPMRFNVKGNVKGNIKGGKGIWCGYGAIEKQIVFSEK